MKMILPTHTHTQIHWLRSFLSSITTCQTHTNQYKQPQTEAPLSKHSVSMCASYRRLC